MGCEQYNEAKTLRLYGETETVPPGFEKHMAQCRSCQDDLDEMDEVSLMYREESREPMPPRLRARVRSRRTRIAIGRWGFPSAIAAACLVAVGLWWFPVEPPAPDIPWTEVDFSATSTVLALTSAERAEIELFRGAPPSWDRVSFSAVKVDRIRRRLKKISDFSSW